MIDLPDNYPSDDRASAPEPQDRLWPFVRRSLLSPVTLALIVLTIPLSVWGVLRTAADPDDHGLFTAFLLFATAMVPTAWSTVRVIWSESAKTAIYVALVRTVLMPLVVAWPPAITVAITVHLPVVRAQLAATQDDYGWRYFFGERDGSLLTQSLVLGGLAGIIFSILTALALSVFVVLPALAWLKPVGTAKSNMLLIETPEDRAAATAGIRLLSVVLALTFAVPTLMIFGAEEATARSLPQAFSRLPRFFIEPQYYYGDFMWALGALLIPIGLFAIWRLRRVQRPDLAARAQIGVNSAEDQRRFENDQREAGGNGPATPSD